ncbi:hypothetical protein J7337_006117 [Fusarium musae]|uniref:Uncharacterized protein n=1 Tax=Fusarium musae TaxID=1042133 RepID=A0A9P8DJI7_9HYPO|nr:hypothetical protein J7337_006117 [Fusarium musae]KAG9503274.1 hypothetical protein J7337_006117 [Fusarium musae]
MINTDFLSCAESFTTTPRDKTWLESTAHIVADMGYQPNRYADGVCPPCGYYDVEATGTDCLVDIHTEDQIAAENTSLDSAEQLARDPDRAAYIEDLPTLRGIDLIDFVDKIVAKAASDNPKKKMKEKALALQADVMPRLGKKRYFEIVKFYTSFLVRLWGAYMRRGSGQSVWQARTSHWKHRKQTWFIKSKGIIYRDLPIRRKRMWSKLSHSSHGRLYLYKQVRISL